MSNILSDLLQERGVLLADGATGSNLFSAGLQTGDSPELWNDIHPDRIAAQYSSFITAGSDIILTNTFGGTRYRLGLHSAEDRVAELNIKAAKIARKCVEKSARTVIVGGSMGPTGEILEPLGSLTKDQATDALQNFLDHAVWPFAGDDEDSTPVDQPMLIKQLSAAGLG